MQVYSHRLPEAGIGADSTFTDALTVTALHDIQDCKTIGQAPLSRTINRLIRLPPAPLQLPCRDASL